MSASLVKSFTKGFDNFATAKRSPAELYSPTVVMYVCGKLINDEYNKAPLPLIIDGFVV